WRRPMSARPSSRRPRQRSRTSAGPVAVWLIALLVALVATVQLRSQAEVEKSLVHADPATLAFSIDQLSRSNDQLEAQINDLTQPRWTIVAIGDTNRLAETADAMTQQLRSDRRVRQATYRVESDIVIRAVITERPFVYGVP